MVTAIVPTWEWERHLWSAGYLAVAGADEVGRGAMAGPLVAAAVIFSPGPRRGSKQSERLRPLRDSKLLSCKKREALVEVIQSYALCWAIGSVSEQELDQYGMSAGNRIAFERALTSLDVEPDFVLLDAVTVDSAIHQYGLIDGDALCASIAAASILAKVWRDHFMDELHDSYPAYGFNKHKGYCTAEHLAVLARLGPCSLHRQLFAPVLQARRAD